MSTKSTAMPSIFGDKNEDLVGFVMEFLGTKSLVRLGSCSKQLKVSMSKEVIRRKGLFASYKAEFQGLLAAKTHPQAITIMPQSRREELLRAKHMYDLAQTLIDDELGFLEPQYDPPQNQLFPAEHDQFFADPEAYPPEHPSFFMLPLVFYFPADRPLLIPTKSEIDRSSRRAGWLWGAEDHMQTFYEFIGTDNEEYGNPKFPFRKFEHSLNQFFCQCMWDVIMSIRGDHGASDAFRFAAKKLALTRPAATDLLHYVLHHTDNEDEDEDDA